MYIHWDFFSRKQLADVSTVFRAAHDSSREMRRWMGEKKKKN
jgi:hypothetical protein